MMDMKLNYSLIVRSAPLSLSVQNIHKIVNSKYEKCGAEF
jgi:hypothetical protein